MPLGIITNVAAVLIGGLLGGTLGGRISEQLKNNLTTVIGIASFTIGIYFTIKLNTLAVVLLSLILGTLIGELLHLEEHISNGFSRLNQLMLHGKAPDEEYMNQFLSVMTICCASATGIFGCLELGMTGNSSVLFSKSILDFFSALFFGAALGRFVMVIAAPQAVFFLILYFVARLIVPLMTDYMIADFYGLGGVLVLMLGFRITRLLNLRVTNALPGMVLVFFFSYLWHFLPFAA